MENISLCGLSAGRKTSFDKKDSSLRKASFELAFNFHLHSIVYITVTALNYFLNSVILQSGNIELVSVFCGIKCPVVIVTSIRFLIIIEILYFYIV